MRTLRIDPAAGGVVALELSRALPEEALPPDTELVKHLKIRSRLLSDFHGRPIDLRAGVILPRDFATDSPIDGIRCGSTSAATAPDTPRWTT